MYNCSCTFVYRDTIIAWSPCKSTSNITIESPYEQDSYLLFQHGKKIFAMN